MDGESVYEGTLNYLPESLDHLTAVQVLWLGAVLTEFFALVRIYENATDAYWCGISNEYGPAEDPYYPGRWWHPDRRGVR